MLCPCPSTASEHSDQSVEIWMAMVADECWWPEEDLETMEAELKGLQDVVYSALQTHLPKRIFKDPAFPSDGMEFTLPAIARDGDKGLGSVPKEILEKCLQPVMSGLQNMDAGSLLEMKQVERGARFAPGVFVEGIHNSIEPRQDEGTVRYIHITEVPGKFTMGIFVFPPHGRIPLHDHPEMCVLSRVLYGDLDRLSLDLVRDEDVPPAPEISSSVAASFVKSAWKSCGFGGMKGTHASMFPKGTKRAFRNRVDHLVAPQCTALYPYEGNLHEFVAGPHGAAVLDVLLPPYSGQEGRDCTFYHIREDDSSPLINGRRASWIIPTGQPEDFHCISGWYGGLGVSEGTGEEEEEEDDDDNNMHVT